MDDTRLEQQTALLPVEKLKQSSLDQFNDYMFKEFRWRGETESLKAFVDFCFLKNGEYDKNRIVWMTENTFVRLGFDFELPDDYRDRQFGLTLRTSDYSSDHELSIHSSTTGEAIAALDLLVGLQDSYFERIELQYNGGRIDQLPVCPLSGRHLENFVRNANRESRFSNVMFTRDQCRTLATSGIRTNIGFMYCKFEDEGIAFLEASAARENQESGPAKLSIRGRLLFDEGNFRLFLSQHTLESLKLHGIPLLHEESCRALAAADLQNLELPVCQLVDGGAALVESVREGRGPRELTIGRQSFDSPKRFVSFINALRGNTYLQRLDLSTLSSGDGSPQALASSLLENKGLVHFGLDRCDLGDHCWSELMAATSMHPTLRALNFRGIRNVDGLPSSLSKRDRTKAIANMLLVNKHIDEIPFCCTIGSFDREDWDALVAPRVECNLYRKRFVTIPKIQDPSTRAAVVARALARVERNPSLIWMVLSQSHDVVCSYLLNEDVTSRPRFRLASCKRSRSPSDDDQGAHRIQSK
jgi:hypothetical protein